MLPVPEKKYLIYQDNPEYRKHNERYYLLVLGNLLTMSHNFGNMEEYRTNMVRLQKAHKEVGGHQPLKFEQRIHFGLILADHNSDLAQLQKISTEFEAGLKKYGGKLSLHKILDIQYNLSIVHFKFRQFDQARDWLDVVLTHPKVSNKEYVSALTRILDFFLYYELQLWELLPHRIVSTYRYLMKRDKLGNFERIVIRLLKNLPKSRDRAELTDTFKKFAGELKKLPKSEYQKLANDNFNYLQWVEEKIIELR